MKSVKVLVLAATVVLAQTDVLATTTAEDTVSPSGTDAATETGTDNVTVTGSVPASTGEATATTGGETVITSVSESSGAASTISVPLTITSETSFPTGVLPTNGTVPASSGLATVTAGAAVNGVAVSGVLGGLLAALVAFA
ncbi:hypothetical protein E4U55_007140 [Claviceps digitariae]|nr:hypothetical protein E4U55_007140 [Claviceps digitariae]